MKVRQSLYKEINKFEPAVEKSWIRVFQQNSNNSQFAGGRSMYVPKKKWYPKRESLDQSIPIFDETIVKKYFKEGLHILSDVEIIVDNYLRDEKSELNKQILMEDTNYKNTITAIRNVAEYGSLFLFMEFESSFGSFGNVHETYDDIKDSIKYGKLLLTIACTIKINEASSTENTANSIIEDHCLEEDM